jgi:hypothetical protein
LFFVCLPNAVIDTKSKCRLRFLILPFTKLSWRFVPGGKTIHDDTWYQDPDDERRDGGEGDGFDYLRDSDRCFKNGIYCRSCCPKPPDCNQDGEWGPAKLCINRVPRNDGKGFHVLVMKCIPLWGDW